MSQLALDAPADTRSSSPSTATVVRDAAVALGGFVLLGAAAGAGSGDPIVALRTVPSVLAVVVGANLLTGPALLVAHQFARLDASPEDLVRALVEGVTRCGWLAAGLAPTALFFAATSRLWGVVLALALMAIGVVGFATTEGRLRRAETACRPSTSRAALMAGLVVAWCFLTLLVGSRLCWDVASFVVGV